MLVSGMNLGDSSACGQFNKIAALLGCHRYGRIGTEQERHRYEGSAQHWKIMQVDGVAAAHANLCLKAKYMLAILGRLMQTAISDMAMISGHRLL